MTAAPAAGTQISFGPIQQVHAGVLDVGYVDAGPRDGAAVVVHDYRWRLGLAHGESQYDDLERRLADAPDIVVPTITLEGDATGAPHPDAATYADKFTGTYEHPIVDVDGHRAPSASRAQVQPRPAGLGPAARTPHR